MKEKKFILISIALLLTFSIGVTSFASNAAFLKNALPLQGDISADNHKLDKSKLESGENINHGFKDRGTIPVKVDFISIAARTLGKTVDELKTELKDAKLGDLLIAAGKVEEFKANCLAEIKANLDSSVKAGDITQTQADEMYKKAEEKIKTFDGTNDFFAQGAHKFNSKRMSPVKVDFIAIAAKALGKTVDELKTELKDTKLGDLLIAAGKVEEFKANCLTEIKTNLDSAVKAGDMTQAQADEMYKKAEEMINSFDGTTDFFGKGNMRGR